MYSQKFSKFITLWQDEFAYEKTLEEQACFDKNGNPIPWYTYPATEYLSQFDYSDKSIFEYGCGFSSLFWAQRARQVISIEDNPAWFEKWQQLTRNNLTFRLETDLDAYVHSIFDNEKKYDIIAIDGKRRAACAHAATQALKDGGFIILDDSDRVNNSNEYVDAVHTLKKHNLLQVDFYGFSPMDNFTKATSVFFSRDFNFSTLNAKQPANGIGNLWGMGRRKRKEFYRESYSAPK